MSRVKSKIEDIIKDEEQYTKVITNLNYLKQIKHDNMLRRGNFINRNVAQMHLNIKNEDWVDNLCAKLDSKMQHK